MASPPTAPDGSESEDGPSEDGPSEDNESGDNESGDSASDSGSEADVEALCDAVAALVDGWSGVDRTVMFGCPSFRVDGELFAVLSEQGLSLTNLPDAERDRLADEHAVAPFDTGGRQVTGWATVAAPPDAVVSLEEYVRASYDVAREA